MFPDAFVKMVEINTLVKKVSMIQKKNLDTGGY